jgi:hypothetical protein
LAGDFIDHNELRIFAAAGPRHLCGSGNSNQNRGESQYCCCPGLPAGCNPACQKPP